MTTGEFETDRRVPRIDGYQGGGFLTSLSIDSERAGGITFADVLREIELDLPYAPQLLQIFLANAALIRTADEEEDDYRFFVEEYIISSYYGARHQPVTDCTGFASIDDLWSAFAEEEGAIDIGAFAENGIWEEIAGYVWSLANNRGNVFVKQAEALLGSKGDQMDHLRRIDTIKTQPHDITSQAGLILAQTFQDMRSESPEYIESSNIIESFWVGEAMSNAWDEDVDWTISQLDEGKHVILSGMNGIGKTLYYGYEVVARLDEQGKKARLWYTLDYGEIDKLQKNCVVILDESTPLLLPENKELLTRILEEAEMSNTQLVFILPSPSREVREAASVSIASNSPREVAQRDVGTKYLDREIVEQTLTELGCEADFIDIVVNDPFLLNPRLFDRAVIQFLMYYKERGSPTAAEAFVKEMQSWIDTAEGIVNRKIFSYGFGDYDAKPYETDSGTTEDTREFYRHFGRVFPEDVDPGETYLGQAAPYAINYLDKN
jgi:hypothetical protein